MTDKPSGSSLGHISCIRKGIKPGMVAHICNVNTLEVENYELQAALGYSEALS